QVSATTRAPTPGTSMLGDFGAFAMMPATPMRPRPYPVPVEGRHAWCTSMSTCPGPGFGSSTVATDKPLAVASTAFIDSPHCLAAAEQRGNDRSACGSPDSGGRAGVGWRQDRTEIATRKGGKDRICARYGTRITASGPCQAGGTQDSHKIKG